jgi:hypothetical protein
MSKISIPGLGKISLLEVIMGAAIAYTIYRFWSKHDPNAPKPIGPELLGIGYSQD